MTRSTTPRRPGAWPGSWTGAGALVGAALTAYVAAPCVAWRAEARDPAARAGAIIRAAFAARLSSRCEDLGAAAERPTFACAVDTEAAHLPAVPRACVGRAHRTLRLHVSGTPWESDAARATLGRVAAVITAAFPDDATLAPLRSGAGGAGVDPGVGGLWALGFRAVEVVRDGRVVGRFAVAAVAEAGSATRPQAAGGRGGASGTAVTAVRWPP